MIRAAIYMRVSSAVQAQEGDSIPAQREALHKYIDSKPDMVCVGEYLDDGISGTKNDRTELQRMLEDVQAGRINLILVTKMDRLHRSLRNFLNMQDLLEKHHCAWLAIWEPMYDTSTPQGRMILNTMMNLAQFEAEQTGQRIRQVQSYKLAKGEVLSGTTPPGLKIVNKHLVPDENAHIVREMFEYYSLTGNLAGTQRHFDHLGIFPKTRPAFKLILMNEKYIGKNRDNLNFCEPIIDEALFYDVQRKLSINVKASQKRTYIFSGILRCAECGKAMAGGFYVKSSRPNTPKIKRYRCSTRYNYSVHACPNCKHVYEYILERYMLENIRPKIENLILAAETENAPVTDNQARIASLEKKISKLKELFMSDLISIDEYKMDRLRIQDEIDRLTAESNSPDLRNVDALKELLSQPFEEAYATFSEEDKRYFWRTIVKEIRFGIDRSIEIVFL